MRANLRIWLLAIPLAIGAGIFLTWWNVFRVPPMQGEAVGGQVFEVLNPDAPADRWESKPLAGADVAVLWYVQYPDIPLETTWCQRAVLTSTDASGRYTAAAWSREPPSTERTGIRAIAYPSKNGFVTLLPSSEGPPPLTAGLWMTRFPAGGQTTLRSGATMFSSPSPLEFAHAQDCREVERI